MPRPRTVVRLRALAAITGLVVAPLTVVAVASPADAVTSTVIDGPDVSSYQHPYGARINWWKVRHDGKEFGIVKATEGTSYVNPYFARDYWHIRDAGLVRGSYHFARPGYPLRASAQAQADFYVNKLGDSLSKSQTLPPALDLETTGGLSRGALVTWAQAFLLRVRDRTKRTPMVYTYPYFWSDAIGDAVALERFPLWMASYGGRPTTPSTLWQFSAGATVNGIRGHVDMSRLTASAETWQALTDGRVPDVWQPAVPGSPNHVYASAAAGSAVVRWLPGDTGSKPISHYIVTVSPGGTVVRVGGSATAARITGLANGTSYTFTVQAANELGRGPLSGVAGPVRPMIPSHVQSTLPVATTYGHAVHARALLRRPDNGQPLGGRQVTMLVRRHGAKDWAWSRVLTTNDNGWVSKWLHPTTSVDVKFRYAGASTTRASSTVRRVVVRSAIGAHLSRDVVRKGHPVSFYGRIRPAAQRRVWLQRYVDHRWRVVQWTTADETGGYRFRLLIRNRSLRAYRSVVTSYGGRARGLSHALHLRIR